MTELITPTKNTLKDNPDFFGVYLNLARLNCFTINNEISKKVNFKPLAKEEEIGEGLLCTEADFLNQQPFRIFAKLSQYLPCVKFFDPNRLSKEEKLLEENKLWVKQGVAFPALISFLKLSFKTVSSFRDSYSHYSKIKEEENREVAVDEKLKIFIEELYSYAVQLTKKKFAGIYQDEHFILAESFYDTLFSPDGKITARGMTFLTCLFLPKNDAFLFISKVVGFKATHQEVYNATRDVFTCFCVKLPHGKFLSTDPKQSLLLSMLDDLSRCPEDLYPVLNEEDKNSFYENINHNEYGEEELEIPNMNKRIRYKNRMHYFALRYLDITNALPNLRFQIDLGRIEIDSYPKNILNESVDRQVLERANAFGRLRDFEKINFDIPSTIPKELKKFNFDQYHPHYNFNENRKFHKIGFRYHFSNKNQESIFTNYPTFEDGKLGENLPDGFLSLHELPKLVLLEILNKGEAEKLIKDFLDANKFQIFNRTTIEDIKSQLDFPEPFLKKYEKEEIVNTYEKEELKTLAHRKQKLDEVLVGYSKIKLTSHKQVPTKILNYWLNITDVKQYHQISNRLKAIKDDCKQRLRQIKNGKQPKVGEMATYIARDVINMVIDVKKKKKITTAFAPKLQECLALFADEEKKQYFIAVCDKELGLFDNQTGHPFLKKGKVKDIRWTPDFYKYYLEEKLKWVLRTFYISSKKSGRRRMTDVTIPNDKSRIPYSISKWLTPKATLEKWLENIDTGGPKGGGKKPADLPTNLFDAALLTALEEKLISEGIPFEKKPNDQYHRLLKLWMNKEIGIQKFYAMERHYNVYDEPVVFFPNTQPRYQDYFYNAMQKVTAKKLKERRGDNQRIIEKDVKRIFEKSISENEKRIRNQKDRDRIQLLMVSHLMETESDLKLKLDNLTEILNLPIDIKNKVHGELTFDEEGKPTKRISIAATIVAHRKRKHFGVMNWLSADRRMPELLEYFKAEATSEGEGQIEISYEQIKAELADYNMARIALFDAIFILEETILIKDRPGVVKNIPVDKGKTNIQFNYYLDWLTDFLKEKGKTENEVRQLINFLRGVRNAFFHNKFPAKDIVELSKEYVLDRTITKKAVINEENIPIKNPIAHQVVAAFKKEFEDVLKLLKAS